MRAQEAAFLDLDFSYWDYLFYWARALIILRMCHSRSEMKRWTHMDPKFQLHLIPESFQEPISHAPVKNTSKETNQIFVSFTNSPVNEPTSPCWTLRWRPWPVLRLALEPEQAWACRQSSSTDGKGGRKGDGTEIQPKQRFSGWLHISIVTCWPLKIYSAPPLQDSNLTGLRWSPYLRWF